MTNTQIDDLAARAMEGLLSGPAYQSLRNNFDELAKEAYAMAEEKRRRDAGKLHPGRGADETGEYLPTG